MIIFRTSIFLNLVLCGTMVFILLHRRQETSIPAPIISTDTVTVVASSPAPETEPVALPPFRWSQFESAKGYRIYIANLRAAGCPEPTIEDIVQGDTERAFTWERRQLKLDGTGNGPWSQAQAGQLVASLLQPSSGSQQPDTESQAGQIDGGTTVASASSTSPAATTHPYPLFLQNVDWNALGFDAGQQAAIAQVRQQFLNTVNGLNPNPDASGSTSPSAGETSTTTANLWQTALQTADNGLNQALGSQSYTAYEQQQYYNWFQPQASVNAANENLNINPAAFSTQ